jgi:hypothetical protein
MPTVYTQRIANLLNTVDENGVNHPDDRIIVSGNILPGTCNIFDLGSSNLRWKDLYLSGNTIDLGGTRISRNAQGGLDIKESNGGTLLSTNANGNVGIGTTDLLYNLTVDGSVSASGTIYASNIVLDGTPLSTSTTSRDWSFSQNIDYNTSNKWYMKPIFTWPSSNVKTIFDAPVYTSLSVSSTMSGYSFVQIHASAYSQWSIAGNALNGFIIARGTSSSNLVPIYTSNIPVSKTSNVDAYSSPPVNYSKFHMIVQGTNVQCNSISLYDRVAAGSTYYYALIPTASKNNSSNMMTLNGSGLVEFPPTAMTANNSPTGYFAIASSSTGGNTSTSTGLFAAYQSFNKVDFDIGWHSVDAYNATSGTYTGTQSTSFTDSTSMTGEWLQLRVESAFALSLYKLTPRSDTASAGTLARERAPRVFAIAGSNDGTTWVKLTTQTVTDWVLYGTKTFTLHSTSAFYTYYRIVVNSLGNGGTMTIASAVNLAEWRMFGYSTGMGNDNTTGITSLTVTDMGG